MGASVGDDHVCYAALISIGAFEQVLSSGTLVVVIYSRVPYIHILECVQGDSFKNLGGVWTELAVWDATIDQSSRLWVSPPLCLSTVHY